MARETFGAKRQTQPLPQHIPPVENLRLVRFERKGIQFTALVRENGEIFDYCTESDIIPVDCAMLVSNLAHWKMTDC